jgi:hypothetical protein
VNYNYLLDGGAIAASREVPIDEDTCGEVHLALESRMVELIREGCRRHQYGCGRGGGVTPSRDNEGSLSSYRAEDLVVSSHRANPRSYSIWISINQFRASSIAVRHPIPPVTDHGTSPMRISQIDSCWSPTPMPIQPLSCGEDWLRVMQIMGS